MTYAAGQRWHYNTREQDPESTLTILRVENIPAVGPVAFIAISDLNVVDPRATGGLRSEIRFTELTIASLSLSVTTLKADGVPPEHQALYEGWRRAFDAGNADVFQQPVAEIVQRFQNVCESPDGREPRRSWWLMDTLPDLIWARLTIHPGGTAEVFDSDGKTHPFQTEQDARLFLLEDEFRLWTLFEVSDFADAPFPFEHVHPPLGSSDAEVLPQMLVRWP